MILHYFPLFIFSLVFMSVKFEFVCVSQREDNKNTKTQFSNCLSPKRKKNTQLTVRIALNLIMLKERQDNECVHPFFSRQQMVRLQSGTN